MDLTKRWTWREGGQWRTCWSVEGQAESGQIELLLSPGQLLWRDENSDKYYMLSTLKFKVTEIAIKCQWRKFKSKIR